MNEYKTSYKTIPVTVRIPEQVKETLKQDKINYIYDLMTGKYKPAKEKSK